MSIKIGKTRYGQLLYPDKDTSIGKALTHYGECHYEKIEFLKSHINPGDVVIDVGADIGLITIPLAQKLGDSGYIVAFEQQLLLYYTLCGNIALNNLNNAHAFLRIVSDENGVIKSVPPIDISQEGNYTKFESKEAVSLGYAVSTVNIDSLNLRSPALIKIKGDTYNAILGGKETIKRTKPFIYLETEERPLMLKLLEELGYTWETHKYPMFHSDNFYGSTEDVFNYDIINLFCWPESK